MRLLYLPNERTDGDQIGPRQAFQDLLGRGVLSAYQAYSYLVRQRDIGEQRAALEEWFGTAEAFRPNVIFVQHLNGSYPLDRAYLRRLKELPGRPKLVLYEEDAYGRVIKALDSTLKAVLAECDMAFLGGTGYLAEEARRAGCQRVRYAPHSYDARRFGTPWEPTPTRSYDAVMIANLPCLKRMPWLHMPGGRSRKRMARAMHRALGDRFVLFGAGQGWDGEPYCKGPLHFDKQGEVIRDAWMSVNWSHFDGIAMYSSDRMPISMACGVPHITNYQPGYEHVFDGIPGLFVVKRPEEAVDVALYLLSLPAAKRNDLGARAAAYAREHLKATKVYADIVASIREQLFGLPDWRAKGAR